MKRRSAIRRLMSAFTTGAALVGLTAMSACALDAPTAQPPELGHGSAAVKASAPVDGIVRPIVNMAAFLETFLGTKAFQQKCGSGEDGALTACLDAATVDGNGTTTTPGCWYSNDCHETGQAVKYRRPTSSEGAIIADSVAKIGALIRKNVFAPPLGAKSTSYNYTGPLWDASLTIYNIDTALSTIGYRLQRRYDEAMDRVLLSIEPSTVRDAVPAENNGRNWGIFVFNTRPTNGIIVEIPHPKHDLNTERMGGEAFEKGDCLALFIAGAHRYALNTEDSSAVSKVFDVNGKADVANQASMVNPPTTTTGTCASTTGCQLIPNPDSGFQWAHKGLDTAAPDGKKLRDRMHLQVVQFHGHRECTDKDATTGAETLCSTGATSPNGLWGTSFTTYNNKDVVLSLGGKLSASSPTDFQHLTTPDTSSTLINALRDVLNDTTDKNVRYADGGAVRIDTEVRALGAIKAVSPTTHLTGHKNIQGTSANAWGVPFLHIELDGFARQVDYAPASLGAGVAGVGRDKVDPPPGALGTGVTREDPRLLNLVARKVIWTIDDWTARNVGWGLIPVTLRTAKGWFCPENGNPYFGFDKDEYLDADSDVITSDFGSKQDDRQSHVLAWPNDSTLLAAAHRLGLKFTFAHLDGSYYAQPRSPTTGAPLTAAECNDVTKGGSSRFVVHTTGTTSACWDLYGKNLPLTSTGDPKYLSWTGHREQAERAGLRVNPIYFAPIPCPFGHDSSLTCDETDDIPPRLKQTDGGSTTYHADPIVDARDAWARAEKLGYQSGTPIFLDLEDSNRTSSVGTHFNTQAYVRAWAHWFQHVQGSEHVGGPQYSVGIYCGPYNCGWLKASLATVSTSDEPSWYTTDYAGALGHWTSITTGVQYWMHDNRCGAKSEELVSCTTVDCTGTATGYHTSPPVGCSVPVKSDTPPLAGGAFDSTAWSNTASPFKPLHSGFDGAAYWQYATTPPDDTCHTDSGSTHTSADGYTYNPTDSLSIAGDDWQCRLPAVGDWQKYTQYVDLVSMDSGCNQAITAVGRINPVPKHLHADITLGTYAQAISDFLNSPNPDVYTTAQNLGETPEFLSHLQSVYAAGGARIVDNLLVQNADYVGAPDPGNTVQNPSFEAQTLTGWTTTGVASAIGFQPPWGGAKVAQIGNPTSQALDSTMAQTFVVPPGGARSLSFYYQIKCFDFGTQYDQFWITMHDDTANSSFTLVPQTCSNDNTWKSYEFPLVGFDGHQLTLTVHSHDDGAGNYPTYGWLDNVYVENIGNGGFQSAGGLSQWSTSGVTALYPHPSGSNQAYGTYGAQVGSTNPYTDSAIVQTFVIPSVGVSTLSFDRKVVCLDSVTYAWATATIIDNDTGKSYTMLARTCTNNGTWENTSFSVDSLAGHNVTFRIDVHDDNYPGDPISMVVDNIKLR